MVASTMRKSLYSLGKDDATCAPCTLYGELHSKPAIGNRSSCYVGQWFRLPARALGLLLRRNGRGRLGIAIPRVSTAEVSASAGRSPLTRRSLRCDTLSPDDGRTVIAPERAMRAHFMCACAESRSAEPTAKHFPTKSVELSAA